MTKNQRNKKKNRSAPSANNRTGPPMRSNANIQVKHKYRFENTGSSRSLDLTIDNFLNSLGLMAATVTSGFPLAMSFKIGRISVWSPPSSQGSTSHASVEFWSIYAPLPVRQASDANMSTAFPAYAYMSPPQGTKAYQWLTSGSDHVATIHVDAGGVVDVDVQFNISDAAGLGLITLTGATVGVVYYAPLDGVGGTLVPLALTVAP